MKKGKRLLSLFLAALMLLAMLPASGLGATKLPGDSAYCRHDFQVSQFIPPTCTEPGREIWTCTICGESFVEEYPAKGHQPVSQPGKEPTCVEDGWTEGRVCAVCGEILAGCSRLPALGHDWYRSRYDEPWCETPGRQDFTCRRCGAWYYEETDALGHDWGEWTVIQEPTAKEDGILERVCKRDDTHRERELIPATGEEAAVTLVLSADPDAGKGKRYPGALVDFKYTATNTGENPVYVRWWPDRNDMVWDASSPNGRIEVEGIMDGVTLLYPGESYSHMEAREVTVPEADLGEVVLWMAEDYWIADPGTGTAVSEKEWVFSNELVIPLTYGERRETETHPSLLLTDLCDQDDNFVAYPSGQDTFNAADGVWAYHQVVNDGDVPLVVVANYKFAGGTETRFVKGEWDPDEFGLGWYGSSPISDVINPGTDTDELLGTVTLSFWYEGYDPYTFTDINNPGTLLCSTGTVTRTWKVRRPGPWPIPQESKLTVTIEEEGSSTDAAGYRLNEAWDTRITVRNEGPVAVDGYTLRLELISSGTDPFTWYYVDSTDYATWFEKGFGSLGSGLSNNLYDWSPFGVVDANDVTRGYLYAEAIVRWIDPDSGNERYAYSAPLYLPVISKTGLVLTKGIEKAPENHHYFVEGEPIKWTLSVYNGSEEPIRNVVVYDQGMVVGTFAEIAPGETVPCTVPAHVVTAYEAEVVGSVSNIAVAKGTDLQGVEHTYPSNPITVPTNASGPPLPPPEKDRNKGTDEEELPPVVPGTFRAPEGEDTFCALEIKAAGSGEIHYTLHTCGEHQAAAAQAATMSDAEAVSLWLEEIGKLYDKLYERAEDDGARDAVRKDQAAYQAYIDAWSALYKDDAGLRDLLRLRVTELCCMIRTAPEPLPDSMAGRYATLTGVSSDDLANCLRSVNEKAAEVIFRFSADHEQALSGTVELLAGTSAYAGGKVLQQAQSYWATALDQMVNVTYKAADRETRTLIAAWRQGLDAVIAARRDLLNMLYGETSGVSAEAAMNLYRDALIDACMHR